MAVARPIKSLGIFPLQDNSLLRVSENQRYVAFNIYVESKHQLYVIDTKEQSATVKFDISKRPTELGVSDTGETAIFILPNSVNMYKKDGTLEDTYRIMFASLSPIKHFCFFSNTKCFAAATSYRFAIALDGNRQQNIIRSNNIIRSINVSGNHILITSGDDVISYPFQPRDAFSKPNSGFRIRISTGWTINNAVFCGPHSFYAFCTDGVVRRYDVDETDKYTRTELFSCKYSSLLSNRASTMLIKQSIFELSICGISQARKFFLPHSIHNAAVMSASSLLIHSQTGSLDIAQLVPWSDHNNIYASSKVRENVFILMCVSHRISLTRSLPVLPITAWLEIFSFLSMHQI